MKTIRLIREYENAIPTGQEKPRWAGVNVTRLYNIVVPIRNGEARIDTYAVKTLDKATGRLVIKKVARYYSDRKRYWVRDVLRNNFTNELCINWCEQPFGHKHLAVWSDVDAYQGKWLYNDFDFNATGQSFLPARYLNGFEGTRYEHCGYSLDSTMHFLKYAECWRGNHATEYLGRAGLYRFVTPAFIRRLSTDRGLFTFFRSHMGELLAALKSGTADYRIADVEWAYRHGRSLGYARAYNALVRSHDIRDLPKVIDRHRLLRYLAKTGVTKYQYARYCNLLGYLGIDMDTYGYMFPTRWTRTFEAVSTAADEKRKREEKAQKARERRERKRRLEHWRRVCGCAERINGKVYADMTLVVPKGVGDLKAEGIAMHNCIGSYGERFNDGRAMVLFLRKDGNPFVDIEIDPATFKLVEARRKGNRAVGQRIRGVAERIASEIREDFRRAA